MWENDPRLYRWVFPIALEEMAGQSGESLYRRSLGLRLVGGPGKRPHPPQLVLRIVQYALFCFVCQSEPNGEW